MALKHELIDFPGLSHHAFQHPFEMQALAALRNLRGLPTVIKFLSEKGYDQYAHLQHVSRNLRVDAKQYPSLYKHFDRMAQVLDIRNLPSLYIETTPTINAYGSGLENYSIVLCSGLIDIMEEDELLAILGHELGHVKCGHQLYKTMAHLLSTFGSALMSQVPYLGTAVSMGLQLALLDWNRKAKFSCDRAALLATQDLDSVVRALAKLAGFSRRFANEISMDALEDQAKEYKEIGTNSLLMNLLKLNTLLSEIHPYPVVRVKEIRQWSSSSEYDQIISGNYRRLQPVLTEKGRSGIAIDSPRIRKCSCTYLCDEEHLFCPNCRRNIRDISLSCACCGNYADADWDFCMSCGTPLGSMRVAIHPAGECH